MATRTTTTSKQELRISTPHSTGRARALRARRGQIKRRLVELAACRNRCEQHGDHRSAVRALRERRYLELVLQMLPSPRSQSGKPPRS